MDIARKTVNTIKGLSIDAIQQANSGHPGMPMGMADAAYVLWSRFLKHDPSNPTWADRDRFVLSGGHGSMLLYSLLHLFDYRGPAGGEMGRGSRRPRGRLGPLVVREDGICEPARRVRELRPEPHEVDHIDADPQDHASPRTYMPDASSRADGSRRSSASVRPSGANRRSDRF